MCGKNCRHIHIFAIFALLNSDEKNTFRMKRIALLAVLSGLFFLGSAQPVDLTTARDYAAQFLSQQPAQKSAAGLELYCTDVNHRQKTANPAVHFYVFNREGGGFVIVSADRRCRPVLAYSTTATFDTAGMPENLRAWMQGYREEIGQTLARIPSGQLSGHPAWAQAMLADEIVSPLIQTHWNQSEPYNALCPMDIASQTRCPTGCVATAMAQVMNFWKYPAQGKDTYSYFHPTYGTLSADFANTSYDWEHMLKEYKSGYSREAADAIAVLMYHCGVSMDMKYAPRGSDANTYFNVPGFTDARTAYMEHFGYDTAIGKIRDNFDPEVWMDMLKEELDNGRPVMYRGTGYGGHSFVCDGYDSEDKFHFNWGWGGSCDGFYSLTAMDPYGYDFSQYQAAVFVQPYKDTADYAMELKKTLVASNDTARLDSTLGFSALIRHKGKTDYSGAFAIGLYTLNGQWVGSLEEKHHRKLAAGDSLQLDFQWTNLDEFQPGVYVARLCYLQSKRWVCMKDANLNYARLLILGNAGEKHLQLLEDVCMLNSDTLTSGDTLKLRYRIGGGKKPCMTSYIVHVPYLLGEEYDYEYIGEHFISHPEDETQLIEIPIARMSGKISGRYALSCAIADRTTGEKVVSNGHSDSCSFFYLADVADLRVSGELSVAPAAVTPDKTFEIRIPVSSRGNIPYTNNTYAAIYDTAFQLLAYVGPTHKCNLSAGESDTLRFNTLNKKKVLKEGNDYYACLLFNSANSKTDQMVKADKGFRNLLRFTVYPVGTATEVIGKQEVYPYPNPTTDCIRLDLPRAAEVQVFSMEGRMVYRASHPEGRVVMDFGGYPKGAYLIRTLESDGNCRTFKVIAQ